MSEQMRWESRGDRLHYTDCGRFRVQAHTGGWLAVREADRRHTVKPTLAKAKRWCERCPSYTADDE